MATSLMTTLKERSKSTMLGTFTTGSLVNCSCRKDLGGALNGIWKKMVLTKENVRTLMYLVKVIQVWAVLFTGSPHARRIFVTHEAILMNRNYYTRNLQGSKIPYPTGPCFFPFPPASALEAS